MEIKNCEFVAISETVSLSKIIALLNKMPRNQTVALLAAETTGMATVRVLYDSRVAEQHSWLLKLMARTDQRQIDMSIYEQPASNEFEIKIARVTDEEQI